MSTVSDSASYSNSLQRVRDSYEAELAETREKHEKEMKELKEEHSGDLREERESAREEVRKLKEELYDSNGRRATKELETDHERNAELARYREEIDRDATRKVERIQKHAEDRFESLARENADRLEGALNAQRRSNDEETRPLRQELSMYRNEARDVESERARARQEAIAGYEEEHQTEKRNLVGSYEKMIEKRKEKERQGEELYARKLLDSEIEADARTKKMLDGQKSEFKQEAQKIKKEAGVTEALVRDELKRERAHAARSQDQLVRLNREDTEKALGEKDRAYVNYIQSNAKRVNSEIDARERIIRDLSTTQDARKVSPAVVNSIRTQELARHHEAEQKMSESNRRNLEATRARDHEERREIAEKHGEETRSLTREFKRENDLQKRGMADAFLDLKAQEDARADALESRARDALLRLGNAGNRAMTDQQKRSKIALEEQRDSLTEAKDLALVEADSASRARDREWFMRFQDQRREYDRRMSILQDEHARELANQKTESERKLQEQERTARRMVEEKDRSAEYRVRQQELSHREKERFLVEHYEGELDKMKRTNAQLIAKKS